jgi:sulfiredoxin
MLIPLLSSSASFVSRSTIKRRATLKPEIVREIAQSMLEVGQQAPILVRRDGDRFVLVHGLHRLEACKALGEETIYGNLVQAEKH